MNKHDVLPVTPFAITFLILIAAGIWLRNIYVSAGALCGIIALAVFVWISSRAAKKMAQESEQKRK